MKPPLIGLTGGIGCGKSEVAKIFAELGAAVIDADLLGRAAVEKNLDIQQAIRDAFGPTFFDASGTLDRKALGTYVFSHPPEQERLNKLVHPVLIREIKTHIESVRKAEYTMIVVDAALIYETGLETLFDKVLVVSAGLPQRIARVRSRDHLTEEETLIRINAQMPLEEKIRRADVVIQNDGSMNELRLSVQHSFELLLLS